MKARWRESVRKDYLRRHVFGQVRPIIHTDWKGYKWVAVGSEIHYSKKWRTFPDFLQDYIKRVLRPDWGQAELAKPLEERHPVLKWYDGMCRFQQKQTPGPDGIYGTVPNSAMRAFLLLAYDLYVLRHHSALQQEVVQRLKHMDQFQGARHELFVAATCIRAGFGINFEDETDGARTHPEFVAKHIRTGQTVSVEAKSRHRAGVLGQLGEAKDPEKMRVRIGALLTRAFRKEVHHPYVVFIELNLPPTAGLVFEKPWFRKVMDGVERAGAGEDDGDSFNLLVITNHPDHYVEGDAPAPPHEALCVFGRNPVRVCKQPQALMAIWDAADKWGEIPQDFDD